MSSVSFWPGEVETGSSVWIVLIVASLLRSETMRKGIPTTMPVTRSIPLEARCHASRPSRNQPQEEIFLGTYARTAVNAAGSLGRRWQSGLPRPIGERPLTTARARQPRQNACWPASTVPGLRTFSFRYAIRSEKSRGLASIFRDRVGPVVSGRAPLGVGKRLKDLLDEPCSKEE